MAESWAMMHTGFIGQNVHLYCSSKGLGTVVRSVGNQEQLNKALMENEYSQSYGLGYTHKKKLYSTSLCFLG